MGIFLQILIELSIASTLFYGIYYLVVKVLKKHITKQCRYLLCLLVVVRMLLPFGVNIPWDTLHENLFRVSFGEVLNGAMAGSSANMAVSQEGIPVAVDEGDLPDVLSEDPEIVFVGEKNKGNTFISQGIIAQAGNELANHSTTTIPWNMLLFAVWIIGAIGCFTYQEWGYLRWKRMILKNCQPAELEDDELLEQMYPTGYVVMLQSDQVNTPLLCGAICPYIILPEGGFVNYGRQSALEHILRHEMYHVRRQDLIWKHFSILAQSIHWFNPFLHSICKELSRCCELSCDEAVTGEMEMQDVRAYGETILSLASGVFAKAPIPVNGFCREKEELMERLEGIMNNRKISGRVLALSLVLVLMMSGCGTMLAPDQGVLADTVVEVVSEVDAIVDGEEAAEDAADEGLAGEQSGAEEGSAGEAAGSDVAGEPEQQEQAVGEGESVGEQE